MLKKVAIALLAASMIAAPVFAAGTTSPAPAKTAQPAKASVKPAKIVGVKKVKRVKQGKRHYARTMKRGKQLQIKRTDAGKRVTAPAPTKPAPKPATSGQR